MEFFVPVREYFCYFNRHFLRAKCCFRDSFKTEFFKRSNYLLGITVKKSGPARSKRNKHTFFSCQNSTCSVEVISYFFSFRRTNKHTMAACNALFRNNRSMSVFYTYSLHTALAYAFIAVYALIFECVNRILIVHRDLIFIFLRMLFKDIF